MSSQEYSEHDLRSPSKRGIESSVKQNDSSPKRQKNSLMEDSPQRGGSRRKLMEQNAAGHKTTMPGIIYHVLNEEPLQSKEGSEAQLQTIIGDESFLRQAFDPT